MHTYICTRLRTYTHIHTRTHILTHKHTPQVRAVNKVLSMAGDSGNSDVEDGNSQLQGNGTSSQLLCIGFVYKCQFGKVGLQTCIGSQMCALATVCVRGYVCVCVCTSSYMSCNKEKTRSMKGWDSWKHGVCVYIYVCVLNKCTRQCSLRYFLVLPVCIFLCLLVKPACISFVSLNDTCVHLFCVS
jgi:hypothetical protein